MNENRIKSLAPPILLVLYFIVYGINVFRPESNEWWEVLLLLGSLIVGTLCLSFIIGLPFKNKANGNIWLTIALFLMLFFVPIHLTLNYMVPFLFKREWHSFLFLSIAMIPLSIFLFLWKNPLAKVRQYLSLLLVIFTLYSIGQYLMSISQIKQEEKTITTNGQGKKYNIYLIIPDGYASTENLKKYWDFDDSTFTNFLEDKGFFIAHKSQSNYRYSILSVSTMLNLNYKPGTENLQWMNMRAIENNVMSKTLEDNGYDYSLNLFNGKQLVSHKKTTLLSMYRCYSMQTALFKLTDWIFHINLAEGEPVNKMRTLNDFDTQLNQDKTTPQFVYIHPLLTHKPFVDSLNSHDDLENMVDENQPVDVQSDSFNITPALKNFGIQNNDPFFRPYLHQIKRTNTILIKTLDTFWSKIEKNSIVIIMSDHGSRSLPGKSEEAIKERYQNFCAIYFPDKDYSTLTDTITPINVMRMTLNKTIGSNLPYLIDKSGL